MTVEDPWATSTPDPEQPIDNGRPAATANPVSNVTNVSAPAEITTTFKGGRDFDAPWVVTRAATIQEADELLDQAFKNYLEKVQRVAGTFAGGLTANPPGAPAAQAAPSRPPQREDRTPPGAKQPPDWFPAPPADDWVYKTGIKNGNAWHAWAPARKGDGEWEFHRPPR